MLPRADINTNRPPGAVEAPTPLTSATDARQEISRRLNQIAIGKELTAVVQAKLDDGTHLVKIANAQARMALPVGAKVGDQLSMVFIAREPRPTFLLTGQAGSANATLSGAARLIDHLLQMSDQDGAPPVVQGRFPLLPSANANAAQLASQLRQALTGSGVFYESHLLDWVSGSRPLTDIGHEPQARLNAAAQTAAGHGVLDGQELARLATGLHAFGADAQALLRMIRDAQRKAGNPLNLDAEIVTPAQAALPDLDPELAHLLQLQLNTLEQQQIRWQGQLWPGQPMEWDIAEERSEHEPDNRAASAWTSVVRFELPHLGAVEATLRLAGERVQVQVKTAQDATASSLRMYGPLLAEALEAAGAPLDALQVAKGDDDATP